MTDKIILGIETSCDDTSIALLRTKNDDIQTPPEVLAHHSFSQETILRKWGGVVPEIAARNHLHKLAPLLEQTFATAKLSYSDIDMIGVTTQPGLLGPLLTGLNSAKTLCLIHQKPLVAVNHLFAHLEAIHLSKSFTYPYLGLLVSGGHSLYLLVESPTKFTSLGGTMDDAAGEAFDKGGKILGLEYPAGRIIDTLAKSGDKERFTFPIGLKTSGNATLSYSGVKTSLRQFIERNSSYHCEDYTIPKNLECQDLKDVCASYQHAIVEALALKLKYAYKDAKERTGLNELPIVVGGGVACNSALRERLIDGKQNYNCHFVEPKFCTDNGAMIANYAFRIQDQAVPFPKCLEVDARGRYVSNKERVNRPTQGQS